MIALWFLGGLLVFLGTLAFDPYEDWLFAVVLGAFWPIWILPAIARLIQLRRRNSLSRVAPIAAAQPDEEPNWHAASPSDNGGANG